MSTVINYIEYYFLTLVMWGGWIPAICVKFDLYRTYKLFKNTYGDTSIAARFMWMYIKHLFNDGGSFLSVLFILIIFVVLLPVLSKIRKKCCEDIVEEKELNEDYFSDRDKRLAWKASQERAKLLFKPETPLDAYVKYELRK